MKVTFNKLNDTIYQVVKNANIGLWKKGEGETLGNFLLNFMKKKLKKSFGAEKPAEEIAVIRGKMQTIFDAPNAKGESYESSFEYNIEARIGNRNVYLQVSDWKAKGIAIKWEFSTSEQTDRKIVEKELWDMIREAKISDYEDEFRYEDAIGCKYGCKDGKPWVDNFYEKKLSKDKEDTIKEIRELIKELHKRN